MTDLRRYITEALGTFTLVVIGPGAAMVAASTHAFGHTSVALAFGLVVTVVVSATGHLSGAHINPAVSIGLWSVRRFPARDVLPYILAQCIGAIAASLLLRWLLGDIAQLGATVPSLTLGRAFAVEAGFTALLGFVIMAVATDDRVPSSLAPFALGVTIFAGALVTGPLTGGSFNPARSLGPAVAGGQWTAHWLYWIAPVTGMMLGMRLYEWLRNHPRAVDTDIVPMPVPPLAHTRPIRGSMSRSSRHLPVTLLFAAVTAVATPQAAHAQAATPAPVAIAFSGEVRSRSEWDHPGGNLPDDLFTYLRTRFGVRVDPTANVRFFLQGQDSRVLGAEGNPAASVAEEFGLHQAYVELRGPWRGSQLALRAGRQEILIGNERLVGVSNWGNIGRSFDGARLTLSHPSATPGTDAWNATLFGAEVEERGRRFGATATASTSPTAPPPDHVVAGAAATYALPRGAMLEGTALYDAGGHVRSYEAENRATLDVRVRSPRVHGLSAELEAAWQGGTQRDRIDTSRVRTQDVRAWLAALRLGTTPVGTPGASRRASLQVGADLLSGDATPHDGTYSAFSTMYASNHAFYGLMDVIGDPASTTRERGLLDVLALGAVTFNHTFAMRGELHRFRLSSGTGRDLGWEGDLIVPVRLLPTANLDIGMSVFRAGDNAAQAGLGAPGATRDWAFMQLRVMF